MRAQLLTALLLLAGPAVAQDARGARAEPAMADNAGEITGFGAVLNGASEVPPNATAGAGKASARYDQGSKTLTWTVEYGGLTGAATAGHIHGPAGPGTNAGVMIPFKELASPIRGSAQLTDDQAAALKAGRLYVNIHTAAHPGGEVRGQLMAAK